jgi:anti-anti-sigma regulatory factor
MNPKDTPYTIEQIGPERAIVRFAKFCDHERSGQYEKQLSALVETHDCIACDLSQTQSMKSDWLRWLCRMTLKAKKLDKEFVMVGVSESIKDLADVLAIEDKFSYAETVENVWAKNYALGSIHSKL